MQEQTVEIFLTQLHSADSSRQALEEKLVELQKQQLGSGGSTPELKETHIHHERLLPLL